MEAAHIVLSCLPWLMGSHLGGQRTVFLLLHREPELYQTSFPLGSLDR